MMLTSIPYFGEVIVMSFRCEHCGATNNEIQSAGAIRGALVSLPTLGGTRDVVSDATGTGDG